MLKYIEIVSFDDEKVVKRIDVTGMGSKQINMIDIGVNRNLNHESYYTITSEYDTEQEINP